MWWSDGPTLRARVHVRMRRWGSILDGTYPVTLSALFILRAVEVVLVVSFPLQTIPLASAVALSHSCPVVVAQCSNEATQKVRMIDVWRPAATSSVQYLQATTRMTSIVLEVSSSSKAQTGLCTTLIWTTARDIFVRARLLTFGRVVQIAFPGVSE